MSLNRSLDAFLPTASPEAMRLRAEVMSQIRSFFSARDFLEVETPLLSRDTVVDRYIDPFSVKEAAPNGETTWLQTSPEFHMKRLLAGGHQRIFQITRAFRREESGERHNPEFTILEWYRTGDTYETGRELLAEFCRELLPCETVVSLTYAAAFQKYAAMDPFAASVDELQKACQNEIASTDRDELLNFLLAEKVEPNLGQVAPTILYDYPASQAALAKQSTADPRVAERFELYIQGVELANGYHELLDAAVLRERNRQTNMHRQQAGKSSLPEESHLLTAMQHGLPACVGVALGVDRLVMLKAGATRIEEVIAFPFDRA